MLFARAGYRFVAFEAQFGFTDAFGKSPFREVDRFASIGLRCRLDRLFRELR